MRERIEGSTSSGVVELFGVDIEPGEVIALGIHTVAALRKGARVTIEGKPYRLKAGVRAGLSVCGGPTGLALDAPVVLEEA